MFSELDRFSDIFQKCDTDLTSSIRHENALSNASGAYKSCFITSSVQDLTMAPEIILSGLPKALLKLEQLLIWHAPVDFKKVFVIYHVSGKFGWFLLKVKHSLNRIVLHELCQPTF